MEARDGLARRHSRRRSDRQRRLAVELLGIGAAGQEAERLGDAVRDGVPGDVGSGRLGKGEMTTVSQPAEVCSVQAPAIDAGPTQPRCTDYFGSARLRPDLRRKALTGVS